MSIKVACFGHWKGVTCLYILAATLIGRASAQSRILANGDNNPQDWPYEQKTTARAFGNFGGWWSFMNENEKAAFLDGFQEAMRQANQLAGITCEVLRQQLAEDKDPSLKAMTQAVYVCSSVADTADYNKVTVKDLDSFYSDSVNQIISLGWSMGYLRDKASGRKTEGQLLDALKTEQKHVHDCSKFPHICTLGVQESEPSR
ncbi:MAG: hypothetical protein ABSF23_01050 [Terracidiphilus sp.]|jgi:hypothetical protein